MADIEALWRELVSQNTASHRQDAATLWKAWRADLGWMAVGAGCMAMIIAMLGGVLAVLS